MIDSKNNIAYRIFVENYYNKLPRLIKVDFTTA